MTETQTDTDTAETHLRITAWSDPSDRVDRVVDILGQLNGVADGTRFRYRGLALEKHAASARARREPEIEVYDPDGEYVTTFQPVEMTSYEIVDFLDEIRDRWVDSRRAAVL